MVKNFCLFRQFRLIALSPFAHGVEERFEVRPRLRERLFGARRDFRLDFARGQSLSLHISQNQHIPAVADESERRLNRPGRQIFLFRYNETS